MEVRGEIGEGVDGGGMRVGEGVSREFGEGFWEGEGHGEGRIEGAGLVMVLMLLLIWRAGRDGIIGGAHSGGILPVSHCYR